MLKHRHIQIALLTLCVVLIAVGSSHAASRYVLGMSAAFTGPSRGLGIELYRGSAAYFQSLNMAGGINGKPVLMETMDDGYHPDPAIRNTISLMKKADVLCLFNYVGTPTVTRILTLLKGYRGYRKPLFFPFTGAEPQRQEPYVDYVFSLRASYRQEIAGLVDNFMRLGMNRIAIFYQADAYGRSGWDGARRALTKYGQTLVAEATYKRGSGFGEYMSSQVDIIKQGKPDAIISVGSYAACAAFIRDARDMGLDVPIANLSFVGSENMLMLLKEAGKVSGRDYTVDLVNTQVVPNYEDLNLPAVREYRELMIANQPDPPEVADPNYTPLKYSFTSFEGFLNAKLMTVILEKLDADTTQTLTSVTESLAGVDIGIGTPVRFGRGNHQGLNRIYYTTVKDGKFVTVTPEMWNQWHQ